MTLFAELQRRNVIRMAGLYLVGAWLVVQVAATLLPVFEAPSWVMRVLVGLLVIGFVAALVFSWLFELTPEGIKRDSDVDPARSIATQTAHRMDRLILMGVAALILVIVAGRYWPQAERGATSETATATTAPAQRSAANTNTTAANNRSGAPRGLRLSFPMPEGLEVTGPIAISRDGRQIAFSATSEGEIHIYLRRLDDFVPKRVEGSRDGGMPFFAPDGLSLGFYARSALWRVATQGGPPTRLRAVAFRMGADWMDDDTIVYSEGNGSAIQRMSADGKALDPVTSLAETGGYAHVWPQQIPGTAYVLFTVWSGGETSLGGAHLADLEARTVRSLSDAQVGITPPARWSASGHVVFENWADGLSVIRFEPGKGGTATLGKSRFLLGDVHNLGSTTRSVFALSETGTLAYVPAVQNARRLVRIQADGSTTVILDQTAVDYATLGSNIALSRDGRLALIGSRDIVLVDLDRKLPRRMTIGTANDQGAFWSPDERHVCFFSNRDGRWKLWRVAIDDSAAPTLAVEHEFAVTSASIGPSGEFVFTVSSPDTNNDLWLQDAAGTQRALLQTPFTEESPALSPDGAWLAYVSDASGSNEVYLIAASGKGVPVQVTSAGGNAPKWSMDGRALLYRKGRNIFQVGLSDGKPVGEAIQRFAASDLATGSTYALASDGNSVLAVQEDEASIPREIRVITDFFDEIERVTAAGEKP